VSFILDALRKSEHDRQRHAGPGLAEVPVVVPQPRANVWAIAAVVLLIVNLVALGVWLIRRASAPEPAPAVTSSPTAEASSPVPQTTVTALATTPPPMLRPAMPAPVPEATGHNPLAAEVSEGPAELEPAQSRSAAAVPEGPPAVTQAPTRGGSVVYESLPEADPSVLQESSAAIPTQRGPATGLPTADELAARGGIAPLRLELHVFSARPAERFVFINSRRYREGDTLSEGPLLEEITRDGVVLNQAGSRFMLTRD
jgi:general secretion pathway protein B